jgi:signal transduction histidine kinase
MPAPLIERGLSAATEDLVDRVTMPTRLQLDVVDGALPPAVESTAYFVVAEGLANALKYADAGELTVRLSHAGGWLVVEVRDDGVGGAVVGGGPGGGSGLRGLADRVDTLGGRVRVVSPPGRGTRLVAELPCGS